MITKTIISLSLSPSILLRLDTYRRDIPRSRIVERMLEEKLDEKNMPRRGDQTIAGQDQTNQHNTGGLSD